jgi:lipid-A-disaccharide synthase
VLALLPFEPAAYQRLDGPPCSYVGHPLIERLDVLKPREDDLRRRNQDPRLLLLLPGSRHSEIARLMPIFKETLARVAEDVGALEVVLPAVPHLVGEIENHVAAWPVKPRIVQGEAEKFACFRRARAALAASGTVTLELALAEVPQIVAYRVSPLETLLRPFIKVSSIVLPNLILGENAVPEFLQEACTPEALTMALTALLRDGPEREKQIGAFPEIAEAMALPGGESPSARAAAMVFATIAAAARMK